MDHPGNSEQEDTRPIHLPFDIWRVALRYLPLRERLPLAAVNKEWQQLIHSQIKQLVFVDDTRNIRGSKGHFCDYELQMYRNHLLWAQSYQQIYSLVNRALKLKSLKLFYLNFPDAHRLLDIGGKLGNLESLELYECDNLQLHNVGQLIQLTRNLKEFFYTASYAISKLPSVVQYVLDNNPSLTILKICETDGVDVWNLRFQQPLLAIHLRLYSIAASFFTNLLQSSKNSLQRFTSELYNEYHHHGFMEAKFTNLRYFRMRTSPFGEPLPQNFHFKNLNVLALQYLNESSFESFHGGIWLQANLQILDLKNVAFDTEDALIYVCEKCPSLQILYFATNFDITEKGVNALSQVCQLEEMQYLGPNVFEGRYIGAIQDNRLAVILMNLPLLRVFITLCKVGQRTFESMKNKANENPDQLYFVYLRNFVARSSESPANLKWIKRRNWDSFFSSLRGDYFEWKLIEA